MHLPVPYIQVNSLHASIRLLQDQRKWMISRVFWRGIVHVPNESQALVLGSIFIDIWQRICARLKRPGYSFKGGRSSRMTFTSPWKKIPVGFHFEHITIARAITFPPTIVALQPGSTYPGNRSRWKIPNFKFSCLFPIQFSVLNRQTALAAQRPFNRRRL